jgi:NtrC-family two-component system response regulator AlgB
MVFATLRPLEEMVKEKAFRSDLLSRINAFPAYIPPLRERQEEILPLAHRFLKSFDTAGHIQGFSSEAALALAAYNWPDNIRGLQNMIRRAVVLCDGDWIQADHLTIPMFNSSPGQQPVMTDDSVSGLITPKALSRDEVISVLKRTQDPEFPGRFRYDEAAAVLGFPPTILAQLLREWKIEASFPAA